jgi:hypothetical protein
MSPFKSARTIIQPFFFYHRLTITRCLLSILPSFSLRHILASLNNLLKHIILWNMVNSTSRILYSTIYQLRARGGSAPSFLVASNTTCWCLFSCTIDNIRGVLPFVVQPFCSGDKFIFLGKPDPYSISQYMCHAVHKFLGSHHGS